MKLFVPVWAVRISALTAVTIAVLINPWSPLAGLGVNEAHADIYNCNGKWQNKPCEGGAASQTIEEDSNRSDEKEADPRLPVGFPSDRPAKTNAKAADDKAASEKGGDEKSGGGKSKCPEGQSFTTSRPKPTMDFQYSPENAGKASGKLKVEGKVKGHGQVKIVLTMSQPGRGEERQAWSKNVSLPDEGGEEEFSKTVDLPIGSTYQLTGTNSGSFRGYCAAAGAKKGDDE